jgi:hypothetical protein
MFRADAEPLTMVTGPKHAGRLFWFPEATHRAEQQSLQTPRHAGGAGPGGWGVVHSTEGVTKNHVPGALIMGLLTHCSADPAAAGVAPSVGPALALRARFLQNEPIFYFKLKFKNE